MIYLKTIAELWNRSLIRRLRKISLFFLLNTKYHIHFLYFEYIIWGNCGKFNCLAELLLKVHTHKGHR